MPTLDYFLSTKTCRHIKCMALRLSGSHLTSLSSCRCSAAALFSSLLTNCNNAIMPPKNKKKDANSSEDKFMRAARFGRVKNDLKMVCHTFSAISNVQCTCCFFSCSIINFNAPISCLTSGLRRSPKCWKINPY